MESDVFGSIGVDGRVGGNKKTEEGAYENEVEDGRGKTGSRCRSMKRKFRK